MGISKSRVPKLLLFSIIVAMLFMVIFGLISPNSRLEVSAQAVSSCLNRVNIPLEEMHWIYIPESANQLHTEENYYFLAGQLISSGVVDASTCPSNGLTLNGYANACGMQVAKPTVIILQNSIDESILQAWTDVGVPPVLLKQMIRMESQFWPSQYGYSHFGYGHITNIGMRNALEWNRDLYAKVCPPESGGNCATSVTAADTILKSLIATCANCEYGIDLNKANRSINILAEVVLGYCYQTAQLVFNATGWHSSNAMDYATLWKLTLMNYNAGSECVFTTVASAFKRTQGPMTWADISARVSSDQCNRGMNYANLITQKYYNFPP